jgi:hypothetical protein
MTIIERKTSYGVRVWRPGQDPEWVGSFNFKAHGGKREAKAAAKRAEEKALKRRGKRMTVKALVSAYLADYEGRHKLTSTRTAKQRSAFLVKHLGSRYVDDLTPSMRSSGRPRSRPTASPRRRRSSTGPTASGSPTRTRSRRSTKPPRDVPSRLPRPRRSSQRSSRPALPWVTTPTSSARSCASPGAQD